ncbi:MAG: PQQ-binding-like beta-propeller repeat protein [Acidobacteria bacterium]|nr:PQQ-binding-like beta-propeller repeat protein [Acidobacteriota bacterium]MYJ05248.1 PQQ-binding-like beta-propeller repeat protein [Acidobacteriota bacterium]
MKLHRDLSARLTVCIVAVLATALPATAQQGAVDGEWHAYGADDGATKYSPLDQIDASNVDRLRVAWSRPTVDQSILDVVPDLGYGNANRATPLMIDGVLYAPNAVGLVEAWNPATGETIWVQRPDEETPAGYRGAGHRGIAYWTDGNERRLIAHRGEWLYALDLATGDKIPGFGDDGRVNLTTGLQEGARYRWGGAPTVVRDVIVMGQSMADTFVTKEDLRGDVRAFDVRTGELRWVFHTIPQAGDPATESWTDGAWEFTGHAPVWSLFAADEKLGYVYMPTSSSTNDMYGGHRPGDNLYTQSIVCVDAETGERVWHYQLVHHGLWDYDIPAAPILADITVDGRDIPAVIQITKQAFAFVFDRVTGEPVWPIEERPVPQSTTPGEVTAPTQPFPTKPPAFDRQGATVENLIDFTPELREEALDIVERYTIGPMFTPPTVRGSGPNDNQGTIQLPGSQGGADIQGASFDPETNILYIPSITSPFVADILEGNPDRTNLAFIKGTREWIGGPRGLPLFKPPYGRVTAIDMNRGEIVWQVPNGHGPRNHPAIRHLNLDRLGSPGRPGPLLTKTLFFLGEGSNVGIRTGGRVPEGMPHSIVTNYGEPWFRAYDKQTGDLVWETELEAGTTGVPMTYLHEGKQYIVVPIGGLDVPGQWVALSLP